MKSQGDTRLARGVLIFTGVAVLGVGAFFLYPRRSHFVPWSHPKQSLYAGLQDWVGGFLMKQRDCTVGVYGTAGTPVVVGYEADQSRIGILRAILPTNFTVRVRRRLYIAVKNVGATNAHLAIQSDSSSAAGAIFPPFYGCACQQEWGLRWQPKGGGSASFGGGFSVALPTDWPATLPRGMTQREAREHDFTKEFHQALVQVFQAQLAKNPRDQAALAALANEYRLLKNYAAAGETYERLFATDYQNPMLLNNLVYTYVEIGGTNLDLAYEQALKAQRLQPDDFVADTVGWVLFKRGDYDQALQVLRKVRAVDPVITFHLAMAYYMHMDEDAARSAFQDFLRQGRSGFQDFPRNSADEITEAKRCLEVLNVGQDNSAAIRRLKARLGQVPDDPVALSRFAALYEQGSGVRNDPLAAKAIGWQAYRRGDFPRAVQYLAESCKERPGDGDLFFYLGMAQHRLSRESECAQSLHKALILNVKHAQAEEAKKALASLSGT